MPSMIALMPDIDDLVPGQVLAIDRYLVEPRELTPLGHGGALYLVAAGPARSVFLLAVLEQPERSRVKKGDKRPDGWYAPTNTVPVTDISRLRKLVPKVKPRPLTPEAEAKLRAMFDDTDAPVLAAPAAASTLVAAIDELLEIWRATRSIEVADLIDRATRLLPRYDRPLLLDARDAERSTERWLEAWESERGEAMPQLLRNLLVGGDRQLELRIGSLVDAPDDPRIARQLARRIHELTWVNRELWIELIRRGRDAGAWQTVAGVLPELSNPIPDLATALAFTRDRLPAAKLDAAQQARVRAIEATLVEDPTERELIDAIAEHRAEEEPYLIYSDWLLERGHPRGEYIALSCQKQGGKLSPALARRRAALESVPFLFGALDDIATTWQRPRPRGIDRSLDVYFTPTNPMWLDVAQHPLVRAIESVRFVGVGRAQRVPGLAAFVRAAPRLQRLDEISGAVATQLVKELGAAWKRDDDSIVRRREIE